VKSISSQTFADRFLAYTHRGGYLLDHEQVYAHAQRLGLHGLRNVASTIAHSHCLAFTT